MAKYVPMDLVRSLSGKVCQHSDVYFAERNGSLYTGKLCKSRTTPYSAKELAHQTKFKTALENAKAAMKDATQRAAYEATFKNQKKCRTLFGYIVSREMAKIA